MWRCNVVAVGCEDDQRLADTAQIGRAVAIHLSFSRFELVADKEVLDRRNEFLSTQEIEAVPPALKLQESLRLLVRVGEDGVKLFPEGRFRLEHLKVLYQPYAVEAPTT